MNPSNENADSLDKMRKEKLIRWQAIRITQFSNTNNLIIGLSTGLLGFDASQFQHYSEQCNLLLICWMSLTTLLISVACGIFCNLTRLNDFRKTTQIHAKDVTDFEKEILRTDSKSLGELSWMLLKCQAYSFFIGVALSTLCFMLNKVN